MVEVDRVGGADTGGFQTIIVEVKDQRVAADGLDGLGGGGEEIGYVRG